jgi:hypothetical protein
LLLGGRQHTKLTYLDYYLCLCSTLITVDLLHVDFAQNMYAFIFLPHYFKCMLVTSEFVNQLSSKIKFNGSKVTYAFMGQKLIVKTTAKEEFQNYF